jgi:hypothetical protein
MMVAGDSVPDAMDTAIQETEALLRERHRIQPGVEGRLHDP